MQDSVFQAEGYSLMGAAFEVHKVLGGGMAEEIYQESLEMELFTRQVPFQTKPPVRITYKGTPIRKEYFPDLLVYSAMVVELKAVSKLLPEHEAQILNYLRITKFRVGYLINFAPLDNVEWKRFVV